MSNLAFDPIVAPGAVDPAWLTSLLRERGHLDPDGNVATVTAERFGTGQVADSFRFAVTYDATGGTGPASFVGKFPATNDASRAFGQDAGLYECEIRFYNEIAAEIPVAVPTPLHAAIDGGRFMLLLEDLAPARVVDQIEGGSPDDLARAVDQLALLHSGSWGRLELADRPWLRTIVHGYQAVVQDLPGVTERFVATLGDIIPEADIDEVRRLSDLRGAWHEELGKVRCLWHQDYRLDNLLFDARGGEVPLAVVDWQTLGMGNGVIDLSQLLGSGLTVEDRRAHERDLVRQYHDGLLAGGVESYSYDECWDDYRALAAHGLTTVAIGSATVGRTERGDRMWKIWTERQAAQTRDLDTMALLAARHGG